MSIAVIGAGAFGGALAVSLASDGTGVTLWGRDHQAMDQANDTRRLPRLPGVDLPPSITVTAKPPRAEIALLATPTQTLGGLLEAEQGIAAKCFVACCKGIDLTTMAGPSSVIAKARPEAEVAVLSGPSFAAEIARGLPTALTLACRDEAWLKELQQRLSRTNLRLYSSPDVVGVELGGALKNVIAIACGAAIGEGLGESARAALMTRGFAEMLRFARNRGAEPQTLTGLSGLGDLALTSASELSRNYRFGLALGRNDTWDAETTVEGVKTAEALARIAENEGIDLPICTTVHALTPGDISVAEALKILLSRPLKSE